MSSFQKSKRITPKPLFWYIGLKFSEISDQIVMLFQYSEVLFCYLHQTDNDEHMLMVQKM